MDEYVISTDPDRLDVEFIVASLQTTYWAGDRPRSVILASMRGSRCFGLYVGAAGKQVGFARVVTDGATFSWLCDVFVAPDHRRQGLGKRLVEAVVSHPELSQAPIFLGTKDAHGLYAKFGMRFWRLMRRLPDAQAAAGPDTRSDPTAGASSKSGVNWSLVVGSPLAGGPLGRGPRSA